MLRPEQHLFGQQRITGIGHPPAHDYRLPSWSEYLTRNGAGAHRPGRVSRSTGPCPAGRRVLTVMVSSRVQPSSWNRVSCSPTGASKRELIEFHGVRTGGAIRVAPTVSRSAVASKTSATSKAIRI